MDLPTLLAEGAVGDGVRDAAAALIARKAATRELGTGEPPLTLVRFVDQELQRGERFESAPPTRTAAAVRAIADDYFRSAIRAFGPESTAHVGS
jgi:uncharacterized protein